MCRNWWGIPTSLKSLCIIISVMMGNSSPECHNLLQEFLGISGNFKIPSTNRSLPANWHGKAEIWSFQPKMLCMFRAHFPILHLFSVLPSLRHHWKLADRHLSSACKEEEREEQIFVGAPSHPFSSLIKELEHLSHKQSCSCLALGDSVLSKTLGLEDIQRYPDNSHNSMQNEFSFWFWKRLKWLFESASPLPKVKEWMARSNMYLSQQVECILGFCAIFCQHVNIIFGYNRFFQLLYPRPHQAAEDERISLGADFIPSSISRIQFFLKTKNQTNKTTTKTNKTENASSIYLCQHSLWL